MKRLLTILAVVAVLALPASALAQAAPYAWTVSASATNPYVNTASFTGALATYYLWYACVDVPEPLQDGMAAAEFDLAIAGISPVASIMQNGFLNAGSGLPVGDFLLAIGACPPAPLVAANLLVISLPGSIDFVPSALSGNKVTVDCSADPAAWPIDWIGLAVGGGQPNGKGPADCITTSVDEQSWGAIKGLYR